MKKNIELDETDLPVCENPAQSHTLPSRFYTDETIRDSEKENIFFRHWIYVGHQSQIQNTGQYFSASIDGQNVFVVRASDGSVNAFYNVCQHRGHELVAGDGKTALFVCPYHAWSYDHQGHLIAAPNSNHVDGFNKCEFSLKSVRVEIFCGMIFLNLDENAVSLSEQAKGLEEQIRTYCPEVDTLEYAQRDTYTVASNWKVMVDNFLECYHCHTAHKDFVNLVDMKSYRSTTHGIFSSHISDAVKSTDNSAFKIEGGKTDFGYAGWFLWPNLTIWIYPGEPNISILQMNPDGVGGTVEYQDWFVPGGKPSKQLQEAMDYQKVVLQPEDIGLCESVQRGLQSRGYNQGRFIVDRERSEHSEHAVHHFQALVAAALGLELS